ncbi:MAG TPA: hypothetical protein VK753_05595 [Xanthomonadaceae bacterium]|nr:hypothetical protein [Xanthomonadaceae bacterium]
MNKFLISILLASCVGVASAQTTTAPTDTGTQDKGDVVAVKDNRQVNSMCVQTGTMVKKNVDQRSARAVDCAGSSPGTTYTRKDIDSTGAQTPAQALEQLDPSVRIHH